MWHALPTPLSSFSACAASAADAEVLARQPLLAELAARMKTRIAVRCEPQLGMAQAGPGGAEAFVGATAIASEPGAAQRAAWLLERAGFHKGYALGPAGISGRHTLAIVNRGGAKAVDIFALRDRILTQVEARFGIRLEPEPVVVG